MANALDSKLPYGGNLKSLLLQNQLSDSYLHKTLQKKGVFIGSNSKSKTVPILCSCLLTPREFSEIKDRRSEKESSTKQRSEKLKLKTQQNIEEILPEINIPELCASEFNEFTFVGIPEFDKVDNNPNHYRVEYEIKCNNHIDSWTEQGKKYKGSVEIKKDGNSIETVATSNHTSNFTNKINKNILSSVKKTMKENGKIEDIDSRVLFNSFNNEGRIKFLWDMTGNSGISNLDFEKITDIDLKADNSLTPPSHLNIDWMLKEVSRMHLSGESLQNTFFLANTNCYPFLIIWKMQAKFRYEIKNTQGSCKINFEFSNYPRREHAEFEISIDSLVPDKAYKHISTRSIQSSVMEELNKRKLEIIDNHKL